MSDEQARLLQEILQVSKEQLATAREQYVLTKKHREEISVQQETALAGQRKALRMARIALVFLLVFVAVFFTALLFLTYRANLDVLEHGVTIEIPRD